MASSPSKKRELDEEVSSSEVAEMDTTASTVPKTKKAKTHALSDEERTKQIKTMIMFFSKEQLIEMLTTAAMQYESVLEEITSVASADTSNRKVFVRGLAWETTSETLTNMFGVYGAVHEAAVIMDKITGKSKGFGFVTFEDMFGAQKALAEPTKNIDGRDVHASLAALKTWGEAQSAPSSNPYSHPAPSYQHSVVPAHTPSYVPAQQFGGDAGQRKLFVRGLSWDTGNDSFRAFFEQYGPIEEAGVSRDRSTGKSRGFGFVTFVDAASATRALQQPQKQLDGRGISCNLASHGNPHKGHQGAPSTMGAPLYTPYAPVGQSAPQQVYSYPQPYGQYAVAATNQQYGQYGATQYQQQDPSANYAHPSASYQ